MDISESYLTSPLGFRLVGRLSMHLSISDSSYAFAEYMENRNLLSFCKKWLSQKVTLRISIIVSCFFQKYLWNFLFQIKIKLNRWMSINWRLRARWSGVQVAPGHEIFVFPNTFRQVLVPTDSHIEWTVGLFGGSGASGAWSWALDSIWCRDLERVNLQL
jgi:hypothetical protein